MQGVVKLITKCEAHLCGFIHFLIVSNLTCIFMALIHIIIYAYSMPELSDLL